LFRLPRVVAFGLHSLFRPIDLALSFHRSCLFLFPTTLSVSNASLALPISRTLPVHPSLFRAQLDFMLQVSKHFDRIQASGGIIIFLELFASTSWSRQKSHGSTRKEIWNDRVVWSENDREREQRESEITGGIGDERRVKVREDTTNRKRREKTERREEDEKKAKREKKARRGRERKKRKRKPVGRFLSSLLILIGQRQSPETGPGLLPLRRRRGRTTRSRRLLRSDLALSFPLWRSVGFGLSCRLTLALALGGRGLGVVR
jgi:hypothetical protein